MNLGTVRSLSIVALIGFLSSCSKETIFLDGKCDLGKITSTPVYQSYSAGNTRKSLELVRAGACGSEDRNLVIIVYTVALLVDQTSVTKAEIDQHVAQARERNLDSPWFYDVGYLLVAANRYEDARHFFLEAKKLRPEREVVEVVRLKAVERGIEYALPPAEVISEIISELREIGFGNVDRYFHSKDVDY